MLGAFELQRDLEAAASLTNNLSSVPSCSRALRNSSQQTTAQHFCKDCAIFTLALKAEALPSLIAVLVNQIRSGKHRRPEQNE